MCDCSSLHAKMHRLLPEGWYSVVFQKSHISRRGKRTIEWRWRWADPWVGTPCQPSLAYSPLKDAWREQYAVYADAGAVRASWEAEK